MVPRQEAGQVSAMLLLKLAAAGAGMLTVLAAQAEIFRCQHADGKIAYQDHPCDSGVQRKVDGPASRPDVKPPPVEDMPPYEAMRRMEAGELPPASVQGRAGTYPPAPALMPAPMPVREAAPAPQPKKVCPTEQDIRKLEVDISSIMNRDKERLQIELRRQLREAKACQ
jgi:hypothetical protein